MDNLIGLPAPTAPYDWREAYLHALFETDRARIYSRIMEAERVLARREHALFADSNGWAEQQAPQQFADHGGLADPLHQFAEPASDRNQQSDLGEQDEFGRARGSFAIGGGGRDHQ